MKNKNDNKQKNKLFRNTSLIIFLGLIIDLLLFYGFNALDYKFNIFNSDTLSRIVILTIMLGISLVFGAIISIIIGKRITQPINNIKEATNKIAKGNFDVRIEPLKKSSLNELINNFNKMAEELKSIETLKSDFISSVSHEFKTPISVIQSYSKILRRKDLDAETRKEYEKVLDSNIQKLSNLTTNILSLSKIENQQITIDKSEYLLDEQIRQSILSLEPEWKEKQIDFDLDLPPTKYYGSKPLLEQVWQNLIGNAIKFSKKKGKVAISLKKENDTYIIKIKDNGIGMSADTQKHIFDKFYQGDTSRSEAGNGLGLAIVSKILELSNAKIGVESQEALGTTFTVVL